nr:adhesion G protein-coupled receptor E2 isoform X2 [Chrysemys picta bellii]
MGTRGDVYPLGLCIALCLGGTVAQNNGVQGTTEDCNNHMLCPANAKCVNNTHCTCLDGYQSGENHPVFFTDTTEICDDINECLGLSPPDCGRNANCNNVAGSYSCSCIHGYEPSSGKAKFMHTSENTCQDIDECQGPSPADCGPHAICNNVAGSYYCTCIDGYEPSSGKTKFMHASGDTCQDIDECQGPRPADCGPYANCSNVSGSYYCTCIDGYEPSSGKANFTHANENTCQDMDECRKTPNICAPKAACINSNGSYRCECRAGYIPSNRNTTLCQELTCPRLLDDDNSAEAKNFPGSFQAQVGRLCKAALEELKQMNSQNAKEKLQGFLDILEKQINLVGQQSESVEQRHRIVTELMATVEKLLRTLALTLPDSTISIASRNGTELGLTVRQAGNQSQETVTLQQSKTQMELKWTRAPGQENEGFTLAGLLTYQGMSPILDGAGRVEAPEGNEIGQMGKWVQEPGRPSYRVLSPVVSAFISDPNPQALGLSVSIRFSHPVPENKTDLRLLCAYWEPGSRRWATHGCTLQKLNATITRCQCNHLTSFAVLMAFYELEESYPLTIITYVGLSLSLLCLFLAILTFLLCHSIRNVSTSLHLQLCLCLFLADLLFLTPVTRTGSRVACAVIAGLLHYLFLACFSWMFLEGLHLFLTVRNLQVVNYTSASRFKKGFMYPFGYGFPALAVAISAAVNPDGYRTSKHCWLSLDRGFRWSFLGPVCAIILINITFFALTLWILKNSLSSLNADVSTLRDHRLLTFKAIAQLFILGCTWSLGLLQVGPAATVMAYFFTIVNSLQGAFIFLVHCLLNRQVREEYRRWIKGFRTSSTKSQTSDLSMSAVPNTSTKTV